MADAPFGAVLAGGESSRYGSPKALATVGGARIIDRVIEALRPVAPDVIISANEPELFADLGLPTYPDERPDLGPLGGIYTTLLRAREAGRPGILAVACDMPFPSVALLALLRRGAFGPGGDSATVDTGDSGWRWGWGERPDIVVPGSRGPRGVEPLFAAYSTACLPAIDAALAEGDRRMIGFHERVRVHTIPLDEVAAVCDPARAFLNVNTPEDRDRAEAMAREADADEGSSGGAS
ncbi:MAG: molybdenum cofactor guanylyltransferase [Longimicrobiales bacterium]